MMRVVNGKRLLAAALVVPMLVAGVWLVAAERGPFVCDNGCQIAHPLPDGATAKFVEDMKPLFNRWFGDMFWNKGDIYIICNATHCAKYYITDNLDLFGTNDGRMQRVGGDSGSGMASGGGETGGQGGYDPGWNGGGGGGSTGGGTGTVHVGDPQTVQE